jgi:hypothetical protein
MDVLGLLALGAVAVLWIATGLFVSHEKTERFFQGLDAERKRELMRAASREAEARRRVA